jgi:SAM-dependent methyltransferase
VSIRWPAVAAGLLALLVVLAAAAALSCLSLWQTRCSPASLFEGRRPLDVPYAETRPQVVRLMLDMARVGPSDRLLDLGTGDGRILIAAARDRGASGLGVDIDPALIEDAQANARRAGVAERAAFRTQDLFAARFSDFSVVTMFLLPEVNLRLRPRLLAELRPGARIVSHAFDMGEWRPDETRRAGGSTVYLWRVPARAGGRWRFEDPALGTGELQLDQRFQILSGTFRPGAGGAPLIVHGRLEGAIIRFTVETSAGSRTYQGTVAGGTLRPVIPAKAGAPQSPSKRACAAGRPPSAALRDR